MSVDITTDPIPLQVDERGNIRIAGTRVALEMVISAFNEGLSPEEIANEFTSLNLGDIYSVVGYYLRHQHELDQYIANSESEDEQARQRIDARWDRRGLRERLLARRAQRGN